MIFRRALLREFGNLALAVFATLFAITLTTQLVRLLGQAAIGDVLSEGVVALLAFSALNYLPVLLSLTLFITVLMTLSRSYRESEMVIWFGSGLSLLAWIRPVLLFAAPLVALTAVLSLFLSPWAIGRAEEYRRQMNLQDDVSRVSPGVFREAGSADRVFFVEESPAIRPTCKTYSSRRCGKAGSESRSAGADSGSRRKTATVSSFCSTGGVMRAFRAISISR